MATATDVLRVAAGQIGYSRWNDSQQGTKYGRWYAASHGSYYGANGVPYCAMFVSWVMAQAGQSFPGLPAAYVPYVLSAGRAAGREVAKTAARPGDLVIFNWDGGVVDHIGFVEVNRGSYLQTIEGNTNNGAVARRTRAWGVVAAILRPSYGSVAVNGALAVDGYCGVATVSRWQRVMGTPVDGVITGQVVPDNRTYGRPNLMSYGYGGYGSTMIRAVQRKIGGLSVDGLLGPATIRAIQRRLGVAADAWFGPATVKALQKRLNSNRF
ncbi:CHAP domain-containing protein [Bifidobacterium sp. 82T24]|uniref:CHAP domain-containing protein n=1 Tax=Bifidobacterium pluvialisilvae TaxID=2834436 RepID=UPI001C58264B|nr:CHAP domain-containing protein [Bifidobacterium pluvialisilvae]MBW3088842.1 CHAP domain-containing protein [Bifidobacterium pluvialisilvae]